MRWSLALIGAAGATLLGASAATAAAVDYFLQIDGISGASMAQPGAIQLTSFQWGGAGRPVAGPTNMDRESSRPSVSEIVITKTTDSASPLLFRACANGKHFPFVSLALPSPSGASGGVRYTLSDVVISSDTPGPNHTETLTLHFTKITWTPGTAMPVAASASVGGGGSNPWAPH